METLSAQLKQIADEDEFYGYRGSYDFSERLSSVLSAIDNLLRPQDPQAALNLTETFLALADEAFQRVDDSDGYVGGIFRDATNQWLAIAAELRQRKPDAENWLEKVLTFFDNNDYGVLDDIITNSAALLTEQELRQLAAHFEADAKAALASPKDPGRYNFEAAHACIGIKSVAEALQDMALYEQATLLTSPVPNTPQLASIIDFALAIGNLDSAGRWLEQPQWQDGARQIQKALDELLVDGIRYEKLAGEHYKMELFDEPELEAYLDRSYQVQHGNQGDQVQTPYDYIECDSHPGRRLQPGLGGGA